MTATSKAFPVRTPHKAETYIHPCNFILFLSSNGVETTRDLSNRSMISRIRKRPKDYAFPKFDGLPPDAFLRKNQGLLLGAVFTVVRAWIDAGRPVVNVPGHDFREWAGAAGWISENILKTGPLMEGHESAKLRVSDPNQSFVRALCVTIHQIGRTEEDLSASDLYEIADENDVKIPRLKADSLDAGRKQIGRIFKKIGLRDRDEIEVDGFMIRRVETDAPRDDGTGYLTISKYVVSASNSHPTPYRTLCSSNKKKYPFFQDLYIKGAEGCGDDSQECEPPEPTPEQVDFLAEVQP